jgi:hypothetical protein
MLSLYLPFICPALLLNGRCHAGLWHSRAARNASGSYGDAAARVMIRRSAFRAAVTDPI